MVRRGGSSCLSRQVHQQRATYDGPKRTKNLFAATTKIGSRRTDESIAV